MNCRIGIAVVTDRLQSGLNDYRGPTGTYIVNKTYRPIYYHEFVSQHESRKRYWARSFFGWTNLHKARPNPVHYGIKRLGELGVVSNVITQSRCLRLELTARLIRSDVDSFHKIHQDLKTTELHGFLRSNVCVSCGTLHSRDDFQATLKELNPSWAEHLEKMLLTGALTTDDPSIQRERGLRTNPDGDVDLPGAPYTTFRYPACKTCLHSPPKLPDGSKAVVEVDKNGAWQAGSTAGILKPAVVMFGETIKAEVKEAAHSAIDNADRLLVIGSSLATYSAYRLAKQAKERGMPIAVLNLGGTRGEEEFFQHASDIEGGAKAVRCNMDAQDVIPALVKSLEQSHL